MVCICFDSFILCISFCCVHITVDIEYMESVCDAFKRNTETYTIKSVLFVNHIHRPFEIDITGNIMLYESSRKGYMLTFAHGVILFVYVSTIRFDDVPEVIET